VLAQQRLPEHLRLPAAGPERQEPEAVVELPWVAAEPERSEPEELQAL